MNLIDRDEEVRRLRSHIAAVEQLLEVHERTTIEQSERLEGALAEAQALAAELELQTEELQAQAVHLEEAQLELETANADLVARAEEAERARAEIERLIASRSRFFAAMSHELRTPINAILGYNELILDGIYGPLAPKQAEGLGRAQRATGHLLELVNDVLDLSKIEAGKLEIEVETVSIPQLIEDLFATVRPLAEERGSGLKLIFDECVEPIVTDPRRVRQILLNLLSNALKFGQSNPVHVRCLNHESDGILLEIVDQGVGIVPEDRERIFEEFVQLSSSEQGGTGLGLPISRRLAELLGGSLVLLCHKP